MQPTVKLASNADAIRAFRGWLTNFDTLSPEMQEAIHCVQKIDRSLHGIDVQGLGYYTEALKSKLMQRIEELKRPLLYIAVMQLIENQEHMKLPPGKGRHGIFMLDALCLVCNGMECELRKAIRMELPDTDLWKTAEVTVLLRSTGFQAKGDRDTMLRLIEQSIEIEKANAAEPTARRGFGG